MSKRGFVTAVGFAVVAVGAFVVLDRYGGTDRFADLPGDADVRLVGKFSPKQVAALAALPQAAAAECATTLYGVTIVAPNATLAESTVLTAARNPRLRRVVLSEGQYPATDTQVLLDEQTAQRHGLHVGERLSLTRGPRTVGATVVGIVPRPVDRAIGQHEAVALLPTGAVTRLDGDAPCAEVTVRLRKRSEATAFQKAVRNVLGGEPGVTYDESLRGHV